VIYSYKKSQRDALFLKFILIKHSTCFGQIYCPSSGVSTLVYTAIGICHASYVDYLLADSRQCISLAFVIRIQLWMAKPIHTNDKRNFFLSPRM